MKYPAFQVTKWMPGTDSCLESWYEHFIELDTPVAIVENHMPERPGNDKLYKRFAIWIIGEESVGLPESNNRNGNNKEIVGKIIKEAKGFSVILNSELHNQRLETKIKRMEI